MGHRRSTATRPVYFRVGVVAMTIDKRALAACRSKKGEWHVRLPPALDAPPGRYCERRPGLRSHDGVEASLRRQEAVFDC